MKNVLKIKLKANLLPFQKDKIMKEKIHAGETIQNKS